MTFFQTFSKASCQGPNILSPKTGYKGMTQHPAPAGILYGLNCPPIGGERKALLLVNLSGSCYWVEFDATNEAVEIPFPTSLFDDHYCDKKRDRKNEKFK